MMCKCVSTIVLLCLLGSGCSFTRKVQTGLQAYEVKQFSVAIQLFEEEYGSSTSASEKAQIAFLTGESYTNLNDPASSASWYNKAYKDGYGMEALAQYAGALKQQEKYIEAIQAYEELLKASPGNAGYRSSITLCRQAVEWKKTTNAAYEIAPAFFNSADSDYSPYPIGPGQVLFTSDRDAKQNSENYLWTGRAFSDLYVSTEKSKEVIPFDPVINSSENDGTAIISPDGKTLVFTRCYPDEVYDAWCKLMFSIRQGNIWSAPEPFPFVREKINYGHPAFAANGTTLLFSCDAPEGQGGHDIFYSQSDAIEGWTEPVNLGALVNTIGDELYPTVFKDTLYYSSNHLAGLGGLDIFKTYLDLKGEWVPPINVRTPINSGGDDFGFVVDTFAVAQEGILLQGYFTSSRTGASGKDDIYSFKLLGNRLTADSTNLTKVEVPKEKQIDDQLFLALRVVEPLFEIKDDPNSNRVGKNPLPNGPVILSQNMNDQRLVTDELGQLLLKLEWNKQYTITARYRDHLAATYSINTADVEKNEKNPITTINQILELDPIFKNMEIEIENIFYDYDQWAIREDARPSLNQLSATLIANPAIRIQLSSHTDCRGTEEYNLDLSQKRAQAAIDYLISTGIPAKRLVAQGFGESNLSVDCICEQCTEEQHQANRRTTFTIID